MSSGKGLGFGIDDVAPIQIAAGQTQHQHLCRGQIAGIGDVVLVAQAIDVGDVLVGGLVAGIVEAQHQIDLVVGDAGSDLLGPPWEKDRNRWMVSPVASEMIWPVVAVAHRVC